MLPEQLQAARNALQHRRTKIVATIGPASSSPGALEDLIEAGVDVFRLNFSHGSHEGHATVYEAIRAAAERTGRHVAILADLCGPKIRTGRFAHGGIDLDDGATVTITTRDVTGQPGLIPTEYEDLARDVKPGDRILMNDGNLAVEVLNVHDTEVECRVLAGGRLSDRKGINLPGVTISTPSFTTKDRADARFAIGLGVDFVALSFVRTAADVGEVKRLVHELGKGTPVIAKIEKPEALEHITEILQIADGIMVARGDLGVEMAAEEVPIIQRELTRLAIEQNRIVIVATQMLESMIDNPRPTRAEVTDVAWASMAGADAVMLSGETAVGAHPVEAVKTMARILRLVEGSQFSQDRFEHLVRHDSVAGDELTVDLQLTEAISRAASHLSRELSARAIVVRSFTGHTAQMISAERPAAPILAITADPATARRLALCWGVMPQVIAVDALADPVQLAPRLVRDVLLARPGQFVMLVSGGQTEQERSAPGIQILLS